MLSDDTIKYEEWKRPITSNVILSQTVVIIIKWYFF